MTEYNKDSKDDKSKFRLNISSIQLSKVTRTNINNSIDNINEIEHPPTASVLFTGDNIDITKEFRIDPFIFPPFDEEKKKLFGYLLGVTDTMWDNIPKLIGETIIFEKKDNELKITQQGTYNSRYDFLINTSSENLYCDDVSNLFIDLLVTYVKDIKVKYAYPKEIIKKDNIVEVKFETEHGAKFKQKFIKDKNKRIKKQINEKLFSDTIGPKQHKDYTFEELCTEIIGYKPEDETKIIGEPVDIKYTISGWKIDGSMKHITY